MEQQQSFFEDTQDLLQDYVNNRIQLLKLQITEKSAKLVSLIFTSLAMALLSFFILLFLSIMAGYFFAEKTGSQFYGFGIVAAFYVIVLIVLILLRRRFDKNISDKVVRIFFDSIEENDDTGKKD